MPHLGSWFVVLFYSVGCQGNAWRKKSRLEVGEGHSGRRRMCQPLDDRLLIIVDSARASKLHEIVCKEVRKGLCGASDFASQMALLQGAEVILEIVFLIHSVYLPVARAQGAEQ